MKGHPLAQQPAVRQTTIAKMTLSKPRAGALHAEVITSRLTATGFGTQRIRLKPSVHLTAQPIMWR